MNLFEADCTKFYNQLNLFLCSVPICLQLFIHQGNGRHLASTRNSCYVCLQLCDYNAITLRWRCYRVNMRSSFVNLGDFCSGFVILITFSQMTKVWPVKILEPVLYWMKFIVNWNFFIVFPYGERGRPKSEWIVQGIVCKKEV